VERECNYRIVRIRIEEEDIIFYSIVFLFKKKMILIVELQEEDDCLLWTPRMEEAKHYLCV